MSRLRNPYPDDEEHWLVIPIGPSLDPEGDRANLERGMTEGARILGVRCPAMPPRPPKEPR